MKFQALFYVNKYFAIGLIKYILVNRSTNTARQDLPSMHDKTVSTSQAQKRARESMISWHSDMPTRLGILITEAL